MARAHEVVGEIVAIPPIAIRVGHRLRPIDPTWAAALGAIMAAEGQRTPIEVCQLPGDRGYLLVSGGHRLEGARLAALPTINAVIVDANKIERRSREVSENLWRKGLDPIDRAAFVAELVRLKKVAAGLDPAKDGRAASAVARWSAREAREAARDATGAVTVAYGWSVEVGEKLGIGERTVRRDLALYRLLLPDVVDLIRGHPLAASAGQLMALTRLTHEDQRAVATMIVSGRAKTPADAVATLRQIPKPSPETKAWSAFFGGWSRMSGVARRDALDALARQGLPKGWRIVREGEAVR
ncbi:MAG: ParB/RepB/Spo0J family partition protein [Caulobacteraceae bacterium]